MLMERGRDEIEQAESDKFLPGFTPPILPWIVPVHTSKRIQVRSAFGSFFPGYINRQHCNSSVCVDSFHCIPVAEGSFRASWANVDNVPSIALVKSKGLKFKSVTSSVT
jgi:hypothetical protein